jgi:hypothetical protein
MLHGIAIVGVARRRRGAWHHCRHGEVPACVGAGQILRRYRYRGLAGEALVWWPFGSSARVQYAERLVFRPQRMLDR